jgi:hypothetical protein
MKFKHPHRDARPNSKSSPALKRRATFGRPSDARPGGSVVTLGNAVGKPFLKFYRLIRGVTAPSDAESNRC